MKMTYPTIGLALALAAPFPAAASSPIPMVMYKNPSCTCCEAYAAYLEESGLFKVELRPSNDVGQIAAERGVPTGLQGCHTIEVGDYIIEGFVPLNVVKKMLVELPPIAGVGVPGMPVGAPGMPGTKTEPWTIYAFTKDGKAPTVYAVE